MKHAAILAVCILWLFCWTVPRAEEAAAPADSDQWAIVQAVLAGDESVPAEDALQAIDWLRGRAEVSPDALEALKDLPRPVELADKEIAYILNIRSNRFHRPGCVGVRDMAEKNRVDYYGARDLLLLTGFRPCQICKP